MSVLPLFGEPLTRAETEILQSLADGLAPAEIADARFISKRTVQFHLRNIYVKLLSAHGPKRRAQAIPAINEARRRGLIR